MQEADGDTAVDQRVAPGLGAAPDDHDVAAAGLGDVLQSAGAVRGLGDLGLGLHAHAPGERAAESSATSRARSAAISSSSR